MVVWIRKIHAFFVFAYSGSAILAKKTNLVIVKLQDDTTEDGLTV